MFTRKIQLLTLATLSCIFFSSCGDTVDDGEGKEYRVISESFDSEIDCQMEDCESEKVSSEDAL